jgi:hypothetical protein
MQISSINTKAAKIQLLSISDATRLSDVFRLINCFQQLFSRLLSKKAGFDDNFRTDKENLSHKLHT